jgi:hypothetical protein
MAWHVAKVTHSPNRGRDEEGRTRSRVLTAAALIALLVLPSTALALPRTATMTLLVFVPILVLGALGLFVVTRQ